MFPAVKIAVLALAFVGFGLFDRPVEAAKLDGQVQAREASASARLGEPAARPAVASPAKNSGQPQPGNPVPEPGVLLLVGTGLLGVALTSRRSRARLADR